MPVTQVQSDPVYNLPYLYLQGLNTSSTSNTTLSISAGQCRDSSDSFDIVVGQPNLQGLSVVAPIILNAAVNGPNGLDTGILAASSVYAVYVIADSRYYEPTASLLSLSSNAIPALPYGYDSYRLICYCSTTSGSVFNPFITIENDTNKFVFLNPPVAVLTAGASQTAAPLPGLPNVLPALANQLVTLKLSFTGTAAGQTASFRTGGTTNNEAILTAQAASVANTNHTQILTGLVNGAVEIDYINSAAGGSTTASVGYYYVFV